MTARPFKELQQRKNLYPADLERAEESSNSASKTDPERCFRAETVKCSLEMAGHASGASDRQKDSGWKDRPTLSRALGSEAVRASSGLEAPLTWSQKGGAGGELLTTVEAMWVRLRGSTRLSTDWGWLEAAGREATEDGGACLNGTGCGRGLRA